MKRFFILGTLLLATLLATAQTQRGYVKTIGRPDKAGEPLSGVTLRVTGQHNPVVSGDDGSFSLVMPGMKNGDAYTFQQIQKSGYELNENDFCRRQHAFSDKVQLEVTMVSTEQLQADKQRIEDNAHKTAERNYKAKLAALEQQLADSVISVEQYRMEIQSLQVKFEKYQSLIDGLAEHYAHTDYDLLDENDREINICIENGDLERADSLIQALFDPLDVLQRNRDALAKLDEQIAQAQGVLEQANADMAAVLKQQEKDAEYLYQLYTIALAHYDNEKAQFYIETRVALDTTKLTWLGDAATFERIYTGDFEKAIAHCQSALRQALARDGEESASAATFYNENGLLCMEIGDYEKAFEYHLKTVALSKKLYGPDHEYTGAAFNNLGNDAMFLGRYEEALRYHDTSAVIRKAIYGENHPVVAFCYDNISVAYQHLGELDKAIEYQKKVVAIHEQYSTERGLTIANAYNNLGLCYLYQGDGEHAMEYFNKTLQIYEVVLNENHPHFALLLNNIGGAYNAMGQYDKALEYLYRSLAINKLFFDDNHLSMIENYVNIGGTYYDLGDYEKAVEYFLKAIAVEEKVHGPEHPNMASSYNSLAAVYSAAGEYEKALSCLFKALDIWKKYVSDDHPYVLRVIEGIAIVYYHMGDYEKALEYYNLIMPLLEKNLAPDDPNLLETKRFVSHIQDKLKEK